MTIALDGEHVVWSSGAKDGRPETKIEIMGKEGSDRRALAIDQPTVRGIGVDSSHVYWGVPANGEPLNGAVMMVALAGGSATTLAGGLAYPGAFLIEANALHWRDLLSGDIVRATKDGRRKEILVTLETFGPQANLAADATHLYAADTEHGEIKSIARQGGAITTIATDQQRPTQVVTDGHVLFWANDGEAGGTIMRMDLPNGTATKLADISAVASMVVDDRDLYVVTFGAEGKLVRLAKADGASAILATGAMLSSVAVDERAIYWVAQGTYEPELAGAIFKLAK